MIFDITELKKKEIIVLCNSTVLYSLKLYRKLYSCL